jgi:hypothetical protein
MGLIDELEDRMVSWSGDLSQTTYWMANVVRSLVRANADLDLVPALAACTRIDRRAHVVSSSMSELERLPEPTQAALRQLLRHEAEELLFVLLADLRQGDESVGVAGNVFLYGLVDEAGLMPELQAAVRDGLADHAFTLGDVAARFVGFSFVVGGSGTVPSGASFSGALFTRVTGVEADSIDHLERGDWTDTSWAQRRLFAMSYVHVEPDAGPSIDPADDVGGAAVAAR